ncbi:PEPxxWA-CTERM sorting domain-containing protein [Sphingomonas rubra]|uniref:PEP-CTERM protein-sorting domain-containing protein n=1 Tax=Sphingomonas rubra TaxID=634430 RepID=A0A1I5UTM9_9SPHN|nr:PEPxxWA-CTERM sorting domain-containing protein [Sphingomonas rubra]SFP98538.1 PEP-CTERM protein-sorting domain-containing protein [Sphingomonas rubra]
MRFGWVVAAAAMVSAAPASAATIVQYDSEQGALSGFQGFDSRQGTLNKVTLDISLAKYRTWMVESQAAAGTVKRVDWTVDGTWSLSGFYLRRPEPLLVSLVGAGTSYVTLTNASGGQASGYFDVIARGATSIDLDPSGFVNQFRGFDGFDTGYNDPTGADTTITASGANRFVRLVGSCFSSSGVAYPTFEDFCGTANYRLTYDYTPLAVGGVPEPATWAMLLVGFGAIGSAMRRRKPVTALA